MTALVEPPKARSVRTALSNAFAVKIREGRRSSRTSPTMRRPVASAAASRRECGRPRQHHAERFGKRRHRRSGAHRVARAGGASQARFELLKIALADPAGAKLVPILPQVRAGPHFDAAPAAFVSRAPRALDGGEA